MARCLVPEIEAHERKAKRSARLRGFGVERDRVLQQRPCSQRIALRRAHQPELVICMRGIGPANDCRGKCIGGFVQGGSLAKERAQVDERIRIRRLQLGGATKRLLRLLSPAQLLQGQRQVVGRRKIACIQRERCTIALQGAFQITGRLARVAFVLEGFGGGCDQGA